VRLIPQQLGAQTRDILEEIGYSAMEIKELEATGVLKFSQSQEK